MSSKTNALRNGNRSVDAVAMLKAEHVEVRKLLAELAATTTRSVSRRTELLSQIACAIRAHSRIEEDIFYPAYQAATKKADDKKLYFEALEEHHLADLVLAELEKADPSTEVYSGKVKVLKDLIEHHAEEEEAEMFPRMRKLLSKSRLQDLGDQMRALEDSLEEDAADPRANKQDKRRAKSASSSLVGAASSR